MRTTIAARCELPGGIVVHAENDAEVLFLRQFAECRDRQIIIANQGGNTLEGVYSIMLQRKPADSLPAEQKESDSIQFDGKSSSRDKTASERENSPANAPLPDPCLNNPVTAG